MGRRLQGADGVGRGYPGLKPRAFSGRFFQSPRWLRAAILEPRWLRVRPDGTFRLANGSIPYVALIEFDLILFEDTAVFFLE